MVPPAQVNGDVVDATGAARGVLPRAGFSRVKAVERGRENHGVALKQVTKECRVSIFCFGVKVTNMNRCGGSHLGIGVNQIHYRELLPVA